MSNDLTKEEIISLIEQETARCMSKLSEDVTELKNDITEIKIALLGGNKIKSGEGLISMVNYSYEHARVANDLEAVPKMKKIVKHYEEWNDDGTWKKLEELLDSFNFSKRLIAFLGIGSAAGIAGLILALITAFDLISKIVK